MISTTKEILWDKKEISNGQLADSFPYHTTIFLTLDNYVLQDRSSRPESLFLISEDVFLHRTPLVADYDKNKITTNEPKIRRKI